MKVLPGGSPTVPPRPKPIRQAMSPLLETVCIVNTPGVTEGKAIALAKSRLEMRGMKPAADAYSADLVGLINDAVKIWQVSFLVHRPK
jgi:hypothetical protein